MNKILENQKAINHKVLYFSLILIAITALVYNIVIDLLLILTFFAAAYIIGTVITEKLKFEICTSTRTAIGLGIIGVLIYYILLLGFGSRSVYLIIFLLIGILGRKIIRPTIRGLQETLYGFKFNIVLFIIILILFIIYITYGSAPINKYDTLVKHLPMTLYAADTGGWYLNVVESIVYGETMVLQYTYSAVFACFGAYKALCLFNVVLFYLLFKMVVEFSCTIYKNTNKYLLAAVYFTTPIFFEFSTVYYLDILPMYFLMAAVLRFADFDSQKTWRNLPTIAFLFGCSIFSKLTIIPSIFVLGIVIIILSLRYISINKNYLKSILRLLYCGIIFIFPSLGSVCNIWYKTGNPVFPLFNEIFKSPYFGLINFSDPFQNQLGLNIQSLTSIILDTSRNIEMADGGLGIYLFLIIALPIAILLFKDKKFILWSILPLIIFQISCFLTYNLRYYMFDLLLLCIVISISASVIINKISSIKLKNIIIVFVCISIAVPSLYYIQKWYNVTNKIIDINPSLVQSSTSMILDEIPENKNIVSFNDPLKGDYRGFYYPLNWYNGNVINLINSGELSLREFISSFDYALYQKNQPVYLEEIESLLEKADNSDMIITPVMETETHILYEINKKPFQLIYEQRFNTPVTTKLDAPITYQFDAKDEYYIIEQSIDCKKEMEMRYQINWYDSNDQFMNTSISVYKTDIGINTTESAPIQSLKGAAYGIVFIVPHDESEASVTAFKLFGQKTGSYINDAINKFNNRDLLR